MIASLGVDSDPATGAQDLVALAMADTLSQGLPSLANCALMCAPDGANGALMPATGDETYLGSGTGSQLGA